MKGECLAHSVHGCKVIFCDLFRASILFQLRKKYNLFGAYKSFVTIYNDTSFNNELRKSYVAESGPSITLRVINFVSVRKLPKKERKKNDGLFQSFPICFHISNISVFTEAGTFLLRL
jgi:hypothetical protein